MDVNSTLLGGFDCFAAELRKKMSRAARDRRLPGIDFISDIHLKLSSRLRPTSSIDFDFDFDININILHTYISQLSIFTLRQHHQNRHHLLLLVLLCRVLSTSIRLHHGH